MRLDLKITHGHFISDHDLAPLFKSRNVFFTKIECVRILEIYCNPEKMFCSFRCIWGVISPRTLGIMAYNLQELKPVR